MHASGIGAILIVSCCAWSCSTSARTAQTSDDHGSNHNTDYVLGSSALADQQKKSEHKNKQHISVSANDVLVIELTPMGQLFINNKRQTNQQVEQNIKALAAKNLFADITLRCPRNLPYQQITPSLDMLARYGLRNVRISTY